MKKKILLIGIFVSYCMSTVHAADYSKEQFSESSANEYERISKLLSINNFSQEKLEEITFLINHQENKLLGEGNEAMYELLIGVGGACLCLWLLVNFREFLNKKFASRSSERREGDSCC